MECPRIVVNPKPSFLTYSLHEAPREALPDVALDDAFVKDIDPATWLVRGVLQNPASASLSLNSNELPIAEKFRLAFAESDARLAPKRRTFNIAAILSAKFSTNDYADDEIIEHPSGVHSGWAALATRGVHKMVMSIGWNPYFNNTVKTIANFPSVENLVAKRALDLPSYAKFKDEPCLTKMVKSVM
ncbi:uncharacterized protein LOC112081881 [Eutrema salsugineum]|uniref:uncharacterized protein LOC112081881 n=1 Tax=Eutrema salsugineum TaxID=72664 RepID=UPI000CECFA0E|nr:uncharacterized protein LOC112081881 [Eutrema salsugineum]